MISCMQHTNQSQSQYSTKESIFFQTPDFLNLRMHRLYSCKLYSWSHVIWDIMRADILRTYVIKNQMNCSTWVFSNATFHSPSLTWCCATLKLKNWECFTAFLPFAVNNSTDLTLELNKQVIAFAHIKKLNDLKCPTFLMEVTRFPRYLEHSRVTPDMLAFHD